MWPSLVITLSWRRQAPTARWWRRHTGERVEYALEIPLPVLVGIGLTLWMLALWRNV